MHICHIITRGNIVGGAQSHVRDLIMEQLKAGHTASIICGYGVDIFADLEKQGVQLYCLQSIRRSIHFSRDLFAIIDMVKLIKKINPNILACHTSKAGILGRISGKIAGVKVVYTPHGWIFSEPNHQKKAKLFFWIEKFMMLLCDKVITVSEFDYKLAKQLKLVSENKLIKIHNGIPDIQNRYVKSLYQYNKTIKLITVARLEKPKDFATLFNALALLKLCAWQLDIYGDGSMRNALQEKARELGLAEKINFHGDSPHIAKHLFNSDIFLLISQSEGFPISIIEAMRAGLPVIASNVGGVAEAVKDNKTGMLIKCGDDKGLCDAITTLMSDSERMARYGKAGRIDYQRYFSSKKMASKTLATYDALVSQETCVIN